MYMYEDESKASLRNAEAQVTEAVRQSKVERDITMYDETLSERCISSTDQKKHTNNQVGRTPIRGCALVYNMDHEPICVWQNCSML